uniref:Uncharacterized protein LOC104238945 n=1 Tax=Nicotiana sylvestris TaxID=4096 RepID=A0A1U7XXT3_NICSY|nr:PREDICTED: uncharacterized protein LOC104238945 [Nicotiana sylvestris]
MGELNFFLGLKVKQYKKGTLISQQKYIKELLKRFDMEASKVIDTPIATATRLDMDEPGSLVDTLYDYKANKNLKLYTLVKKEKLTDKRSVREPGSPDIDTAPEPQSIGASPISPELLMNLQEKEAIENMMSIANKGVFVGGSGDGLKTQGEASEPIEEDSECVLVDPSAQEGTTREPVEGPDPPSEDTILGPTQEPQVISTYSTPSPHLDIEPLNIIMPETGPTSDNQKEDSEEDSNDLPIASLPRLADVAATENIEKDSGEKFVKSDKKKKGVRKTTKKKVDTAEKPGSSKKSKADDPGSTSKERLRS